MPLCGAPGVDLARVEQRPDAAQRRWQVPVGTTGDQCAPAGGVVQAQDHAHRRGLAGAVGTEESGDVTGTDGEGEVVDGQRGAVPLGQLLHFDHRVAPRNEGWSQAGSHLL